MNSQDILYSKGKNDECETLEYAVYPILKYLSKSSTIWCPFDKEESQFVQVLRKSGYNVIFSHIDTRKDD